MDGHDTLVMCSSTKSPFYRKSLFVVQPQLVIIHLKHMEPLNRRDIEYRPKATYWNDGIPVEMEHLGLKELWNPTKKRPCEFRLTHTQSHLCSPTRWMVEKILFIYLFVSCSTDVNRSLFNRPIYSTLSKDHREIRALVNETIKVFDPITRFYHGSLTKYKAK